VNGTGKDKEKEDRGQGIDIETDLQELCKESCVTSHGDLIKEHDEEFRRKLGD
jgi:hypothetical protein